MSSSVHPVDEKLPLWKLLFFGFQHVLAMYSGAVAVPLVLAQAINLDTERLIYLINADLFTCGIATLVQTLSVGPYIGSKLPIVQGCTFTAVMPMIIIANFWVPSSPASWATTKRAASRSTRKNSARARSKAWPAPKPPTTP